MGYVNFLGGYSFQNRGDQDALHELKDLRSQADELRRELKMLTNAAFEAEETYGELDGNTNSMEKHMDRNVSKNVSKEI